MPKAPKISLVLADVDGTLVDSDKKLTERALTAVRGLHDAGIRFAITSGRPPRGMAMLFEALRLDTPVAGFNGGLIVDPDLTTLELHAVPADVAAQAIDLIVAHGLDAWVYRGNDWLLTKRDAPHVEREIHTVEFEPKVVDDLKQHLDRVTKIVGVSDDHDRMERCEAEAQKTFGQRASAARSQPYYLDVTSKRANKGAVVDYLSRALKLPPAEMATMGDQPNDLVMFERSGFSIAVANAPDEVKAQASATTASNDDEGFAKAIERFILARDAGSPP